MNLISYGFFIYILLLIDTASIRSLDTKTISKLGFAIFILVSGQLVVAISWSKYLANEFKISFLMSLQSWLISIKGKYTPGKIASPILRLEDSIFDGKRKQLYFSIFIEQLYLIASNIFLSIYVFFVNSYKMEFHILAFILFSIFLNLLSKLNFKKFDFKYLRVTYILQFSVLLNFLGIFLSFNSILEQNVLIYTLVYQLSTAVGMIISIVPAGVGVREVSVIQLLKVLKIEIENLNLSILIIRVQLLIADLVLTLMGLLIKILKKNY